MTPVELMMTTVTISLISVRTIAKDAQVDLCDLNFISESASL